MTRTSALFLLLTLAASMAFAAPIHDAAKKGDVAEVRRLLDEGTDANAKDDDGSTPLSLAIRETNGYDIAFIKLLLERGADVNIQDKRGNTALFWCVGKYGDGQREVFDLLMQKGATVDNRKNSAGYSLADFAVSGGNVGILKELIGKGAKLDIQKSVSRAANLGSKETLEYVLNAGGNPNADGADGRSPLMLCFSMIGREHVEKAKLLLDRGAKVNARSKDGTTALSIAIINIGFDGVRLLLERGADVNLALPHGNSPLITALLSSASDRARILKLFLDNGAEMDLVFIEMLETLDRGSNDPGMHALAKTIRQNLRYCMREDNKRRIWFPIDELIASKNIWLPEFLSTATNEQKVKLLMDVEKGIARAKVRMGALNEQARKAIRKGETQEGNDRATSAREEAIQVGASLDVLKEIKTILEGS